MSAIQVERVVGERAGWRSVAIPSEHGGWGLTLEPVLLGLVVAWSGGGVALGIAAFTVFLLRTPAKLVALDVRRGRWLDRSRLALRIALIELVVLGVAVAVVVASAGWSWLVPVVVAGPLVAIELSYDIRSRGRRLLPELCGAIGIGAVAASIVLAAHRSSGLAIGVWLVLAARAVGAIPFVRVQIMRLRRGQGPVRQSDMAQVFAVAIATLAAFADGRLLPGLVGVVVLAVTQAVWVRRAPIPAKRVGLRQMVLGLALVAVTAVGVLW
ncbi:MAG: YwiC-like family protein [Ilumatobacteraceae bacterium]